MKLKFLLPLLVLLAMVAMFARGLFLDPGRIPSPLIGKPLPHFELPDLHTPDSMITSESLKGRIFLLNVFGSWCVGCHEEHALLMQWAAEKPFDVEIIGLNWKDEPDTARAWLARDGNPYAQIAVDYLGDVAIDYGVYGAPETFLVDANGIIRFKHVGPLTEAVVQDEVFPLIRAIRAEEQQ